MVKQPSLSLQAEFFDVLTMNLMMNMMMIIWMELKLNVARIDVSRSVVTKNASTFVVKMESRTVMKMQGRVLSLSITFNCFLLIKAILRLYRGLVLS